MDQWIELLNEFRNNDSNFLFELSGNIMRIDLSDIVLLVKKHNIEDYSFNIIVLGPSKTKGEFDEIIEYLHSKNVKFSTLSSLDYCYENPEISKIIKEISSEDHRIKLEETTISLDSSLLLQFRIMDYNRIHVMEQVPSEIQKYFSIYIMVYASPEMQDYFSANRYNLDRIKYTNIITLVKRLRGHYSIKMKSARK